MKTTQSPPRRPAQGRKSFFSKVEGILKKRKDPPPNTLARLIAPGLAMITCGKGHGTFYIFDKNIWPKRNSPVRARKCGDLYVTGTDWRHTNQIFGHSENKHRGILEKDPYGERRVENFVMRGREIR